MNSDSFPEYFRVYIDKIPEGESLDLLKRGVEETVRSLAMVSEDQANGAYAEGKWSVKDVLQHMIDTERIFSYRALSFARGEQLKLAGYDHDEYAKNGQTARRSLREMLEEFRRLRASTIDLFSSFSEEVLQQKGNANGLEFTVEQLQFILIGHEIHHRGVLEQKYL